MNDKQAALIVSSLAKVAANIDEWADILDGFAHSASPRQLAKIAKAVDEIETSFDQLRENAEALEV